MIALMLVLIALGVWFIVSALANWDWVYGIMELGIIEGLFGEGAGRLACLALGVFLSGVGVAGCLGFR